MVDGALEGVRRRRAAQYRSPPRTGSCLSTAAVSATRAARGFRWSNHHFRSMSRSDPTLGHLGKPVPEVVLDGFVGV